MKYFERSKKQGGDRRKHTKQSRMLARFSVISWIVLVEAKRSTKQFRASIGMPLV